jgi:predicted restriction endonuclease
MFRDYVLLTVRSRREMPEIGLKNGARVNRTKRSQNRSQPISVLHDNLVYSSARDSREIVSKNKLIFEKMQEIMKNKEANELLAAFRSCKEEQKQLRMLEQYKRVVPSKEIKGKAPIHNRGRRDR